jgi:hypothetical protein
MRSVAQEEADLQAADRHITVGKRLVAAQSNRVFEQKRRGLDTRDSERLLAIMEQLLDAVFAHRRLIVEELGRLHAHAPTDWPPV